MKIINNILVKITDDDISPDGIFVIPDGITNIEQGAFSGKHVPST